jgi:hypothetical protein
VNCGDCGSTASHERAAASHVYYASTKSLCATCKRGVDASIVFRDGAVWLEKHCPEHGPARARIASSSEWYLDALSFLGPSTVPGANVRPVDEGCPFDCGPCAMHHKRSVMPVVPITSACNLDCPICYTVNRNVDPYVMPREAFAALLEQLKGRDELDIINLTGGEPTLHPELPALLRMAREAGVRRLTVSTNGLRLSDAYVQELAACDARVVLSLDTFDDAIDEEMLGARTVKHKLGVLDLLERHDVTATVLPAIAAGLNDRDVGPLFDLVMARPNVCSLELHTLAFTGRRGNEFRRDARISIPDLHALLDAHTGGRVQGSDFVPSPLAPPHCYSICYLLMLDARAGAGERAEPGTPRYVPFTRFMSRAALFELLGDTLYVEPGAKVEDALRDAIDRLWAEPEASTLDERERDAVLRTLKRLIGELYPERPRPLEERRKIAERSCKAVYIHSHMDAETFDVARVVGCSVTVPEADGSTIPTCSYNVLYRERDPRFVGGRDEKHRALPVIGSSTTGAGEKRGAR